MNYFDLKGQVALVTGCSGGLGVQMAKALASQGCNIVAIARRMEKLQEVCAEIEKEFGVIPLTVIPEGKIQGFDAGSSSAPKRKKKRKR